MSQPGVTRYTPLINGEMMRIANGEYNKYDDTVTALTRLRERCADWHNEQATILRSEAQRDREIAAACNETDDQQADKRDYIAGANYLEQKAAWHIAAAAAILNVPLEE